MIELFVATMVLIILSGLWSGTEVALFCIDINKAKQLHKEGKCSTLFLKMIENKDSYVSTLVFLNNIVNIAGSMFVGAMAIKVFGNGTSNVIFSLALTLMIIVFAEILPKAVGSRKSVFIVSWMSGILEFFKWFLNPVVFLVMKFTNFILKMLFGEIVGESVSEGEIAHLVSEGAKDSNSEIRINEAELIKRVFSIHDTKAKDIMTPRTCLSWINKDKKLSEVAEQIKNSEHSRIVVVDETIDQILGIAFKTKLLIALTNGEGHKTIEELGITEIKTVNEETTAEGLQKIFQKEKKHILAVLDEHGGLSGVVTLEDVVEIVFGEIMDETDSVEDLRTLATERKILRKIESLKESSKNLKSA